MKTMGIFLPLFRRARAPLEVFWIDRTGNTRAIRDDAGTALIYGVVRSLKQIAHRKGRRADWGMGNAPTLLRLSARRASGLFRYLNFDREHRHQGLRIAAQAAN